MLPQYLTLSVCCVVYVYCIKENDCNGSVRQMGSSKFFYKHSFIIYCFPTKIVFHQRLFSIKGHLQSKCCLPLMVIFNQRSSNIKGHFPSKISSIKGHLQSKVIFHPRSSSIKGCFLLFYQIFSRIFLNQQHF